MEIKWESPEDEAKAIQICGDNIECQFDYLSTKDESIANATATNQKKFEEDQAVLGKCEQIRIQLIYWIIPWASYQIRKIAECACAGNAGNVCPASAG